MFYVVCLLDKSQLFLNWIIIEVRDQRTEYIFINRKFVTYIMYF